MPTKTKPKTKKKPVPLDVLMESIGDCLTPEAAKKVLKLKADRKLQPAWTSFR